MVEAAADWLAGIDPKLHKPLASAAEGLPANVASMHVLMECAEPGQAEAVLGVAMERLRASGSNERADRLKAVLDLLRVNPGAFGIVRGVLGGLDHAQGGGGDAVAYWAAAFDRAAHLHPEASVALYSLGNLDLLDAGTREIVERLDDWGLLSPEAECLDIGCGIGRFEAALAGRVRRIVGIDVAPAMVEEARRRTEGQPNVEIRLGSGRDLASFADESFDLLLSVDAFPYIVQAEAGLAGRMIQEAARLLRPDGRLVILNYSYRNDVGRDRKELQSHAASAGLTIIRDGTPEFSLWDGLAFVLKKG